MADFAGAMAHDLNNLLATIAINAELIRDDRGSREQASGTILKAAERGKGLARRLFAFSGQRDLSPARLSVADFLESIKAPIAEVLGADIKMRIVLPLTHWLVCADPVPARAGNRIARAHRSLSSKTTTICAA
jgi:signal transduction histidine kinase